MTRSLTFKLTVAFLLVGLIGSILVAAILRMQTRSAFDKFLFDRESEILATGLQNYYEANGSWAGIDRYMPTIIAFPNPNIEVYKADPRPIAIRYILTDPDRTVLFSPDTRQVGHTLTRNELKNALTLEENGKVIGYLLPQANTRDLLSNTPEARFLVGVNRATLVSALVAAVLALVFGSVLAYSLTGTIRELKSATVEISSGRLGAQVQVRSNDELGELASSFNKMSLDLERATQARRQMTADVAHDLRSPLSVLSGYAEALSDGKLAGTPEIYTILHQETAQLSRLIEDLRTLSLADAGELSLILQTIEPGTLLERLAGRHSITASNLGINLEVQVEPGVPVIRVDVERMAQVLDNLVQNAFRYTPAGGVIKLTAKLAEGRVQIEVCDNGSGISAENLPKVFDRFYRGDQARSSGSASGLGLAIARSLSEAQGGTITVRSTPGKETVFTLTFKPASA